MAAASTHCERCGVVGSTFLDASKLRSDGAEVVVGGVGTYVVGAVSAAPRPRRPGGPALARPVDVSDPARPCWCAGEWQDGHRDRDGHLWLEAPQRARP